MKVYLYIILLFFICYGCGNVSDIAEKVSETSSSLLEEEQGNNSKERPHNPTVDNNQTIAFSAKAKASKFMDERRIYLMDLTRSMEGFNGADTIFNEVKEQLSNTIASMNDTTTEVFIVPFTDKPFEPYSNRIARKDSILNYIADLITKPGDTNILDAWKKGESLLDSTKVNYLFMLTDGVHNTGEPMDSLYKALERWHTNVNGKYQFAFYVLLSPTAKEQEICRIVDSSKQMWLVPSMNIHTDFIISSMYQSVNIIDTNKVKLHLSCTNPEIFNQGFRFKIALPKNDYYQIVDASESIDENGDISFEIKKLKSQKELPISFPTKILIEYDKLKYPFVFFTPEEYNLNIVNVGTRIMNIKNLVK